MNTQLTSSQLQSAVSADTKNIFFVHLVATYSQPTSYVIEVRLMVPDKQILYLE